MESSQEQNSKYKEMAVALENFVHYFVPAGWKEHIGLVMPKFLFTPKEVAKMEIDFRAGTLERKLTDKYKKPAVTRAIVSFFEQRDKRT